jgi:solute carrier family 25 S-adenosylmethionine transporter 26
VEVLKQRSQVGWYSNIPWHTICKSESLAGLFCGFGATLQRELPFAAIQFPLYEALKRKKIANEAICGSIAGGVSAFLTTPLDVIKTRKILSGGRKSIFEVTRDCWREGKMFAGGAVRVAWISIGGFFFFGAYEFMQRQLRVAE